MAKELDRYEKFTGEWYGLVPSFQLLFTKEEVMRALDTGDLNLEPLEMICLKEYYFNNHTLKEVGELTGKGYERVRQINSKTLRKLRHPTRQKAFVIALRNSIQS